MLHVSLFRKYNPDSTHIITPYDIQVKDNLTLGVSPKRVNDRRAKQRRGKEVRLKVVIWDQKIGEATWKLEDNIRKQQPKLFASS